MDELLNAIAQRKLKEREIIELNERIRLKILTQPERATIYAQMRKLKEEEKNRSEKENWIVGIMRNTKQLSEEQMIHIYSKTNEIMKTIHIQYQDGVYNGSNSLVQYLDMYYSLHQNFYTQLNIDGQLKVQFRQAIRAGNINLITDLIKQLLCTSRKMIRDALDELSIIVNRESGSPNKKKLEPVLDRARSSTKKDSMPAVPAMPILEESKEIQLLKDRVKKNYIGMRFHNQSVYDMSPVESPSNHLKQRFVQAQDKQPFQSIYSNIIQVIDDLDEQNIVVLDYQSVKRQSQTYEELKANYESLLEKMKIRNAGPLQSVLDYCSYVNKKQQQLYTSKNEFTQMVHHKYRALSQGDTSYHFCHYSCQPKSGSECRCEHRPSSKIINSPIKNKIVIRKSSQTMKKINKQPTSSFNAKSLIEQIQSQHESYMDYNRYQNSPMNATKQQLLHIKKLEITPVQQYQFYAHRLSHELAQKQRMNTRAQSATSTLSFIEQKCDPSTHILIKSVY